MKAARRRSTPTLPVSTSTAVQLQSVSKIYGSGDSAVTALRDITVDLVRGSFTAIMGPSGSGKSTFLQIAAGLDKPTSGTVRLGDTELSSMNEKKLTHIRRERIGFVFQAFNLMPSLTVAQNITLPLRLAGKQADPTWFAEIVARVGMTDRVQHRPAQLSGGQQQRVAIARALMTRPDVIFADEPTGALDTRSAREVLTLLRAAVDDAGQTVVMVTHDPVAAAVADTVLFLADGRIVESASNFGVEQIADRMLHLGAWA